MEKYEGKCGCGDVEFRFDGEPINAVFCYCRECQIHTGSDKWFGVWVPVNKFQFTKGTPANFTRVGASGKAVNYKFCSACGTTLCAEITVGKFYTVGVSTLTSKNDFTPKMAIYTAHASKWAGFPEGVPKFDILPPGMGG
jgi:hypothetical protein